MLEGSDRRALARGRRIVSDGGLLPEGLSGPILRSWQRCIDRGLDLFGRPTAEPLTARELSRVIERNERLRAAARPELEALRGDAESTGCIAILTDANGVILDAVGDSSFADRAARVALMPGVGWAEQISGTNAIGTALVEGAAVAVQGHEHFFEPHRILDCSASPIRSPTGDLMGVLDISGNADIHHLHALSLVRLSVDQIERRFFNEGAFDQYDLVRVHPDRALIGTAREGILVFEGSKLVAANRHGLSLFSLDWSDLKFAEADQLFSNSLSMLADRGHIRKTDGTMLFGALEMRSRRPMHQVALPQPADEGDDDDPVFDVNTQASLKRAVRLLASDIPVLVQGETGVGKEVFARAAHDSGNRKTGPFITVECAAATEATLERELFGVEGSDGTPISRGHISAADGGTLFLDEIGDMPLPLQAQFLRVLEERMVTPVGGRRPRTVDFNLICSSRRDLPRAVERGEFRSDLYFWIAQYSVALPALRRLDDLAAVIEKLFARLGAASQRTTLAPDTLEKLAAFHWPGNFRQLTGTLKALVALTDPGERVRLDALPAYLIDPPKADAAAPTTASSTAIETGGTALVDVELKAMQAAVEAAGGNISLAAKRLNIHRSTLYRRLFARGEERKSSSAQP
jgi:transcriptional regulator of acetoin/glycerol metabolism